MGVCFSEKPKKEIDLLEDNKKKEPLIPKQVLDKLFNSIIRINYILNEENFIGTGFFIKFELKNKLKYFLMTNHNIIGENLIKDKKLIKFDYREDDKEKNFEIQLDRNKRYIKCYGEPLDVTLVEILDEDNIKKDNFLEPDLNYKNGYNFYKDKSFYLPGYPQNNLNDINIKTVKIINILNNSEFEFTLDTEHGNSGAPICLENNLSVVGIHKQRKKDENIFYGTFLGYILDNIENETEEKKYCKLEKQKLKISIQMIQNFWKK